MWVAPLAARMKRACSNWLRKGHLSYSHRFVHKVPKQKIHEAGFRFFNRSFVQKEERTHRLDLFQSQGS